MCRLSEMFVVEAVEGGLRSFPTLYMLGKITLRQGYVWPNNFKQGILFISRLSLPETNLKFDTHAPLDYI